MLLYRFELSSVEMTLPFREADFLDSNDALFIYLFILLNIARLPAGSGKLYWIPTSRMDTSFFILFFLLNYYVLTKTEQHFMSCRVT